MMSSRITKTNKSRSPASQKVRTTKGKKVADKKPQRPGKITAAPKAKKAAPAKSKKQISPTKKTAAAASKKTPPKKIVKIAAAKPAKKPVAKVMSKVTPRPQASTAKRAAAPVTPAKAVQPPPKKSPVPNALQAVKAFEQALRLFNRHDYAAAKEAFNGLLAKFSEQADIVAPARTYLAICDQRMARTPAVPRNPDALYDQGVVQLNKGNFSEAVGFFEKGLKAEPRVEHIRSSLAAAYARMHQSCK